MQDFLDNEEICRYCSRVGKKPLVSVEAYRNHVENQLLTRFDVYLGQNVYDLVFHCKDCGAVIFGGTDHRLDPELQCPHCVGYRTNLPFWSYDELMVNPEFAFEIQDYINKTKFVEFCRNRYDKTGLLDQEAWRKNIGKWQLIAVVESYFHSGLAGLELHISRGGKKKILPLSFKSLYSRWVFPHTKAGKNELNLPY